MSFCGIYPQFSIAPPMAPTMTMIGGKPAHVNVTEEKNNIDFMKWIPWILLALIVGFLFWAIYEYSKRKTAAQNIASSIRNDIRRVERDVGFGRNTPTNNTTTVIVPNARPATVTTVSPIRPPVIIAAQPNRVISTVQTAQPIQYPQYQQPIQMGIARDVNNFSPEYYCYKAYMDDWFPSIKRWNPIDNGEFTARDAQGHTFRRDATGKFYVKDSYNNWWIKGSGDYWWLKDRDGTISKKTLEDGKMWKLDSFGDVWYRDRNNSQMQKLDSIREDMGMDVDLRKERDFYGIWGQQYDPNYSQDAFQQSLSIQDPYGASVYGNYFALSVPFQQQDTSMGSVFQDVEAPKSLSSTIVNNSRDSMREYSLSRVVGNKMSMI